MTLYWRWRLCPSDSQHWQSAGLPVYSTVCEDVLADRVSLRLYVSTSTELRVVRTSRYFTSRLFDWFVPVEISETFTDGGDKNIISCLRTLHLYCGWTLRWAPGPQHHWCKVAGRRPPGTKTTLTAVSINRLPDIIKVLGEMAYSNQAFTLSHSPLCSSLSSLLLNEKNCWGEKIWDWFICYCVLWDGVLLPLSLLLLRPKPISQPSTCSRECRASEE